jgi:tetratricopeptide (TPR) repeat protein
LSLEIRVKELGIFHEYTAISYNNLAVTYENIKDYKKALLFYEKSLNIREKVLGKEHPLTGDSYSNIGLFYKKRKECNKAEIFMCKAIDVYKQYSYQFDFFKASEEYLKKIRNLIKKEKKVKFKDKGRHCI